LSYFHASVKLVTTLRGRPRREPVWVMRYRLPNGRNSRKVLGPAWMKRGRPPEGYYTQATAEAAARAFLAEHEHDRIPCAMRLGRVADDYLGDLARRVEHGDFRKTTLRTYRNIVANDLLAFGGETPWRDRPVGRFTSGDVEQYRAALVGRDLAPSTLNQHRAVVRGVFAVAVERYGLETSPTVAFAWARSRRANSGRISFYRPDEIDRLIAAAASEQDAGLYVTAAYTGLRRSELRALRWRSLDFDGSLIHVERGYTNEGGDDLPKSYRVRSVPMTPRVAAALACLGGREHFTTDEDLVFVNTVGRPVGDDKLHKRFKTAIRAAGLRELRFHDLRHSFGTMAVRAFPITDVQTWMGHAHIETTRRYVHYAPQADAARAGSGS
jgi:integrase